MKLINKIIDIVAVAVILVVIVGNLYEDTDNTHIEPENYINRNNIGKLYGIQATTIISGVYVPGIGHKISFS